MFFSKFKDLCDSRGISTYKAATEIGLNRASVNKWKSGSIPNGETISKLALYFDVPTDYFLINSDSYQQPGDDPGRKVDNTEIMSVCEKIEFLLAQKGITGSKMCKDLGFSRSFMTELRKGRAKSITADTADKIARYFGISTDFILRQNAMLSNSIDPTHNKSDMATFSNNPQNLSQSKSVSQEEVASASSSMYSQIEFLCSRNGVSITTMCSGAGVNRASLSDLKMGRKRELSVSTLVKIANYFHTSVDSLIGRAYETHKGIADISADRLPPSIKEEPHCNQFSFTLKNGYTINGKITDAQLASVLELLEIPGIGNVGSDHST